MEDFMKGIREGFFRLTNPFNQKTSLVPASSDKVDTIVFWSKDYTRFNRENFARVLQKAGYNLFFHYTINSEDHLLEPEMPGLNHRLAQLEILCRRVGSEAVFWRFDPVCHYHFKDGIIRHNRHDFLNIADAASSIGLRYCVTSFMDFYAKIEKRVSRLPGFSFADPPLEAKKEILHEMARELNRRNMQLLVCCEQEVLNLVAPDSGIFPASCIPGDYLAKLYGSNISLRKDRGQRTRQGCGCKVSVDVGSYRHQPCFHNCLFCYANPGKIKKKNVNNVY